VAEFDAGMRTQVACVVDEECGEGGIIVEFGPAGPAGAGLGVVGTSLTRLVWCAVYMWCLSRAYRKLNVPTIHPAFRNSSTTMLTTRSS
jgi:hypothetical protein